MRRMSTENEILTMEASVDLGWLACGCMNETGECDVDERECRCCCYLVYMDTHTINIITIGTASSVRFLLARIQSSL